MSIATYGHRFSSMEQYMIPQQQMSISNLLTPITLNLTWDRRYVTGYEAAKNSNTCTDPSL